MPAKPWTGCFRPVQGVLAVPAWALASDCCPKDPPIGVVGAQNVTAAAARDTFAYIARDLFAERYVYSRLRTGRGFVWPEFCELSRGGGKLVPYGSVERGLDGVTFGGIGDSGLGHLTDSRRIAAL